MFKKNERWFLRAIVFSYGKRNSCGVAIGYYEEKSFEFLSKFNDKSGGLLIIKVKTENEVLLLINLYNANTKNEQLITLFDLSNMLKKSLILIIKALHLEEILILLFNLILISKLN